jgi:hypothetical protein
MHRDVVGAKQLISQFMVSSWAMEQHLQRKGPLTDLEVESITLPVESLQTFLDIWKQEYGKKG